MSETVFFRLLAHEDKAAALGRAVDAVREGRTLNPLIHIVPPSSLRQVPGSPFAYWVSERIRRLFTERPALESGGRVARRGPSTGDDARRVRAWWEVAPSRIGRHRRWVPLSKGGAYSPYYADVHLLVGWDECRRTFEGFKGRPGRMTERPEALEFFFRPGLTWPASTVKGLNARCLPMGAIFSHKSPTAFVPADGQGALLALVGLMGTAAFRFLAFMQHGSRAWEVGFIQRTPLPALCSADTNRLAALARACADLKRGFDSTSETSHVFCMAAHLHRRGALPGVALAWWQSRVAEAEHQLAECQGEMDEIAYRLYAIGADDRRSIEEALGSQDKEDTEGSVEAEITEDDADPEPVCGPRPLIADLLSYLVGCALGRWDVRFATGERPEPELPDPFAPLPVCSPGMLTGEDGLPLDETPPGYPLRVNWDGILVDDPGPDGNSPHQDDIVRRVREVLELLWGERAEAIEQEACAFLEVKELRDYFRSPRAFFDDHIKRYSKSRRKAPIYWLLQSAKKSYGLWLYYHRLDRDTIFKALRHYVEPKIKEETSRLREMKAGLEAEKESMARRERTRIEKEVERQDALITELGAFKEALERVAALGYEPDLNDGVVLNIAPFHEVTPWKEAKAYWEELRAGKYEWSTMSQRLRGKGGLATDGHG